LSNSIQWRRWEKRKEIAGEAGVTVIDSPRDLSPDLATLHNEFPFSNVYQRPTFNLRSREFTNGSSLTALGCVVSKMRVHINGTLNVGGIRTEITEGIIYMSIYATFPTGHNAMLIAKDSSANVTTKDRRRQDRNMSQLAEAKQL